MARATQPGPDPRRYNVGFGDCFLLDVHAMPRGRPRNVLIDFGSTRRPASAPPAA